MNTYGPFITLVNAPFVLKRWSLLIFVFVNTINNFVKVLHMWNYLCQIQRFLFFKSKSRFLFLIMLFYNLLLELILVSMLIFKKTFESIGWFSQKISWRGGLKFIVIFWKHLTSWRSFFKVNFVRKRLKLLLLKWFFHVDGVSHEIIIFEWVPTNFLGVLHRGLGDWVRVLF